ncbi:hypothetical protein Tco_0451199 [Tanacetum coccineum]
MLGAHSKLSQPLICSWPIRSHRIAKLFIDPCGGGVRGGDGFGVLWGVNEVENDRFGGLCDLAGKLVEDVQYFNFQVWVWGFDTIGPSSRRQIATRGVLGRGLVYYLIGLRLRSDSSYQASYPNRFLFSVERLGFCEVNVLLGSGGLVDGDWVCDWIWLVVGGIGVVGIWWTGAVFELLGLGGWEEVKSLECTRVVGGVVDWVLCFGLGVSVQFVGCTVVLFVLGKFVSGIVRRPVGGVGAGGRVEVRWGLCVVWGEVTGGCCDVVGVVIIVGEGSWFVDEVLSVLWRVVVVLV